MHETHREREKPSDGNLLILSEDFEEIMMGLLDADPVVDQDMVGALMDLRPWFPAGVFIQGSGLKDPGSKKNVAYIPQSKNSFLIVEEGEFVYLYFYTRTPARIKAQFTANGRINRRTIEFLVQNFMTIEFKPIV